MSSRIRLTGEEMRYIALFENVTKATAIDCLIDDKNERLIFITKQGEMGLAIGKGGKNVNMLRKIIGKPIEIVEYADNAEQLIKNSLLPARIKEVRPIQKPDKKIIVVEVEPKDKALAIGKNGKTIEKTRKLVQRYFQIDHVQIK
ncbi:NusA-like transcription termination signal-binding factor [[Eubacterium] cellulosolvens]